MNRPRFGAAAERPYRDFPDLCLATWTAALRELEQSADGEEAGRRFQFSSGYLQALVEGNLISAVTHATMRQQLLSVWHALADQV